MVMSNDDEMMLAANEIKKLQKRIKAWEDRILLVSEKNEALKDVAHDPHAVKHANNVKEAEADKLKQAVASETQTNFTWRTYDGPMQRALKTYSQMSGEDIFRDLGLEFCFDTGNRMTNENLKTLRRALKTFGHPGAEHVALRNCKSSIEMWNEICAIVGIDIPKIPKKDKDETQTAMTFLSAIFEQAKQASEEGSDNESCFDCD